MSTSTFDATARALDDERGGFLAWILAGAVLLLGWGAWAVLGGVTLYAVTDRARLEMEGEPRPIEAPPHDGVVATVAVELGQEVRAGDVLLTLDSDAERSLKEAEVERGLAGRTEIDALRSQIALLRTALESADASAAAQIAELAHQAEEAEASVRLARSDLARKERLAASGHVSGSDLELAQTEVKQKVAAAGTLQKRRERLAREAAAARDDRTAEIARLEGRLAHLEGEAKAIGATVRFYEQELERHEVRSPVDGRVGELGDLRPGSYVRAGERLGTILPGGALRVVAFYPARETGRLQAGQRGRLHLVAYPSTAHGHLPVQVARVAAEPRDGLLRVELAIDAAAAKRPPGPLQHGLAGRLDVAVGRVPPWRLLLRWVGERWQEPSAAVAPSSPSPDTSRPPRTPEGGRRSAESDEGRTPER